MITLLTTPGLRLMGAARLEGMQRVGEGWEWKRGGKRGEETERGGNGSGGEAWLSERGRSIEKSPWKEQIQVFSFLEAIFIYIHVAIFFFEFFLGIIWFHFWSSDVFIGISRSSMRDSSLLSLGSCSIPILFYILCFWDLVWDIGIYALIFVLNPILKIVLTPSHVLGIFNWCMKLPHTWEPCKGGLYLIPIFLPCSYPFHTYFPHHPTFVIFFLFIYVFIPNP